MTELSSDQNNFVFVSGARVVSRTATLRAHDTGAVRACRGARERRRIPFHWHVEGGDIRHAHIRSRTPHLNGKVERSHRVDDEEFYQLLDKDGVTDDIHLF